MLAPTARRDDSPTPGRTRDRRLDLDVVRGVAIVLALGWHFSRWHSGNALLDALQWPGRTFGWAGVDLFFVLSGFLMGGLLLREQARTGAFDGRRFAIRRALKLWPLFYLFLAVVWLSTDDADGLWRNAVHLQNYLGTSLTHLWSLAVEEHFYLVLALFFPLVARHRRSTRVLFGVLVAVIVAAFAFRVHGTLAGVSDVRLQWRTHYRMDSLAVGVLLAVVAARRPELFARLAARRWVWAIGTGLGVWFLATIGKEGAVGSTLGYTVAWATAASFLLLLFKARWVPRAWVLTAPMAALGRYSFGIYVWHVFAAKTALSWIPGMGYHSASPAAQAVKYGTAFAAGILATLLVERPALRLRDRLLPGRDGRGSPVPATAAPSREPVAAAA